jgi:hypothetical protein
VEHVRLGVQADVRAVHAREVRVVARLVHRLLLDSWRVPKPPEWLWGALASAAGWRLTVSTQSPAVKQSQPNGR